MCSLPPGDRGERGRLLGWAGQTRGPTVIVVNRPRRWVRVPADQERPPVPPTMPVLPRRWVGRARRMSTDSDSE